MRCVVQRVSSGEVVVGGRAVGRTDGGLLALVGVECTDDQDDVAYMVKKIGGLRIFDDEDGRMNLSLSETGGSILLVSQFTLQGDCRKGRRPSYTSAAPSEIAQPLFNRVVEGLRDDGFHVETGEFGGDMKVSLVNDGPVTLLLDSRQGF